MGPRHCCRGIGLCSVTGADAIQELQWGHGIAAVESHHLPAVPPELLTASMGPRHCCRGIGRERNDGSPGQAPLQWGHGIAAVESGASASSDQSQSQSFNGATALLPWNRRTRRGRIVSKSTSFNGATALLPWNPFRSSTQLKRRGLLQWGHGIAAVESFSSFSLRPVNRGFNGATALLPWNRSPRPTRSKRLLWLQWGHGIAAVESPSGWT